MCYKDSEYIFNIHMSVYVPEKQTSRQIRSARVLLGIRLVKDKRERTGDVGL